MRSEIELSQFLRIFLPTFSKYPIFAEIHFCNFLTSLGMPLNYFCWIPWTIALENIWRCMFFVFFSKTHFLRPRK